MTHPNREVLPVQRLEIIENAIYDTEGGLQVRVSLVVLDLTMECRPEMDLNTALSDSSPMYLR